MGIISFEDRLLLSIADFTTTIKLLYYAYPPLLFAYFVGATFSKQFRRQPSTTVACRVRRGGLLWLNLAVILTYILESSWLLVHALAKKGWWAPENEVVYVIGSILAWGVLQISLLESSDVVWYPFIGSWVIGLFSEVPLLLDTVLQKDVAFKSTYQTVRIMIQSLRVLLVFLIPVTFWFFRKPASGLSLNPTGEAAPLLGASGTSSRYGAVVDVTGEDEAETRKEEEFKERVRKRRQESGGWWSYAKSFKIFWPHIWPYKQPILQMNMVLVGCCLIAERGLNFMVPRQLGKITDALMAGGIGGPLPWKEVSLFVIFRWLDSGAGIPALHTYLWIPIEQYSYRSITEAAYNHVLNLSSDYHSSKNTGELYSSVSQGRCINGFVNTILFSVAPMAGDLAVAFGYFYLVFGIYMASVVTIVSIVYVWVTAIISRVRIEMRRQYNSTARREMQLMWQTMSSWETVAYFNRIPYEQDRYSGAIKTFLKAQRDYDINVAILGVTQNTVFTIGLLFASFLSVYQVTINQRKVGDFVALLTYWAQLATPLSFFTGLYRRIHDLMLDAERLLELFLTKPSVVDKENAKEMIITKGEVEFENVSFAYDSRKGAISNMSFTAPGGQITALVGETGGGKSTCLKLLFRFYDVLEGSVKIDGQDVRDVTLSSLRENIGVVPQDPKLFNESIMENLKYACFDATDEGKSSLASVACGLLMSFTEVFEACRAAAIHDKILSFPDGYLSKVGEGGVKLSGGERQRISIARAILKNPRIVLLDEATSSVDVATERLIQDAFNKLATGRTMFVIAHRLSTIMNADQILVIDEGKIIERGTHDDLLKMGGKYFALWQGEKDNQVKKKPVLDTPPVTPRPDDLILMDEPIQSPVAVPALVEDLPSSSNTSKISTPLNIKFATDVPTPGDSFRPHTYPRLSMSAPKLEYLKHDKENVAPSTAVKNESVLKPEAKEFVPNLAPGALLCTAMSNMENSNLPSGTSHVVNADEKNGPLDDIPLYDAKSGGGEEQNDSKRRRRHRRRSRSSRNSSGNDGSQLPDITLLSANGPVPNNEGQPLEVAKFDGQFQTGAKRNREAIGKLESLRSSLSLAPDAQTSMTFNSTHFSTLPESALSANVQRYVNMPRPGLYEATPNVPSLKRPLTGSREGRGGSAPRWKPHGPGKGLLHNNNGNGYGTANQFSVMGSKDLIDAGVISNNNAISGQKPMLDKARISQKS